MQGRAREMMILAGSVAVMMTATTAAASLSTTTTTQQQWQFLDDTEEAIQDEIKVLPGWEDELPSRMFAGYVNAGTKIEGDKSYTLHEHYFFVESESDPLKDPLVVWTNGGPGASSMFGLFVELGPFFLSGASHYTPLAEKTGIPSLFRNDYSWSKLANILIINSPPPVGYSYCDPIGPAGDGNSCGTWNDEQTAYHNRVYLESFLEKFPKFQNHDVYITGESYAGVYVPTLVREILDHSTTSLKQNLKGFAVGDGCVGVNNVCGVHGPGPFFHLEFMRGHGQFSEKLYHETFQLCSKEQLIGFSSDPNRGVTNATCLDHLKKIQTAIGPFYDYNLFDACWYQNDLEPPTQYNTNHKNNNNLFTEPRQYFSSVPPFSTASMNGKETSEKNGNDSNKNRSFRQRVVSTTLQGALVDYPCGGDQAFFDWVMTPQVKAALHVAPDAAFFSGDNGAGFTYIPTEPDLTSFYLRAVKETELRVLVYNGDTDPAINSFTSQNWTSHLGIPEREAWRPWTIDGKQYVGGYVTRYENDFDFLTIRGAGHMVPQHKPKVTFEFLSKWLKNEPWQRVSDSASSKRDRPSSSS